MSVNMADSIDQAVTKEERELAEELRSCCTYCGEERKRTLPDSAKVLYKMGILYLDRASAGDGLAQKLDFIKASALLAGAKLRFSMSDMDNKVKVVDGALSKLSRVLLMSAGLQKFDEDIFNISANMKAKLESLRDLQKMKLKNMVKIGDDVKGSRLFELEKQKIEEVRLLNETSMQHFLALVRDLSKKCIDILGDPPCKFATVGLGSLARKEITLYSDFEHVIVLEEGVQGWENYDEIKEYFRWYAVIFQIVIVGLGETFIRSVCVKSINDLYSSNPADNWYYDVYTPCGIAFDGMAPQSCNNPLGKVEATKNNPHIFELIQPAKKMAKFLTHDEEIKNGYYLKDVLTRTCLVYGDRDVYDLFLAESKLVLDSEAMQNIVMQQFQKVKENRNEYISEPDSCGGTSIERSIKATMYRPVTALIAYYARAHRITENATFEILHKMQKKKLFDAQAAHAFSFAVAVACEMRARVYADQGHQRHGVTAQEMLDFVGKHCTVACDIAVQQLRDIISTTLDVMHEHRLLSPWNRIIVYRVFSDVEMRKVLILTNLGYLEEAFAVAEANLQVLMDPVRYMQYYAVAAVDEESKSYNTIVKSMRMRYLQAALVPFQRVLFLLGRKYKGRRDEFWAKAENACKDLLGMEGVEIYHETMCYYLLSSMYATQERFENAVEMFEKFTIACGTHPDLRETYVVEDLFRMRMQDVKNRRKFMNKSDVMKYIEDQLAGEEDEKMRVALQIALGKAQIFYGEKEMARSILVATTDDAVKLGKRVTRLLLYFFLGKIYNVQLKQKWDEDAGVTARYLADVVEGIQFHPDILWKSDADKEEDQTQFEVRGNDAPLSYCLGRIEKLKDSRLRAKNLCILARAHAKHAELAADDPKRFDYIVTALKICEKFPEDTYCADVYFRVFLPILLLSDPNRAGCEIITDLPPATFENVSFQTASFFFLHYCIGCKYESLLLSAPKQFYENGRFTSLVSDPILQQLLSSVQDAFTCSWRNRSKSTPARIYNSAVDSFASLDLRQAASSAWWLLCNKNAVSFIRHDATRLLLLALQVSRIYLHPAVARRVY